MHKEIDALLLPSARVLKAQAALLSSTAGEIESCADKVFALLDRAKAPDADFEALLLESLALLEEMKQLNGRWPRFIKEFNALQAQS